MLRFLPSFLFKVYISDSMTTLIDLRCFLCKDLIPYNNNNKTDFTRHMNNEHMVDFGVDFLLAACLMEEEEREAIQDVVEDKFQIGAKFNDDQSDDKDEEYNDDHVIEVDIDSEITLDEKDLAIEEKIDDPIVITEENVNILDSILSHSIFGVQNEEKALTGTESEFELIKEFDFTDGDCPKLPMPTPIETPEGFPCPECGKVFKTAGNMKYHFRDIHQPGEFPCKGCNKMFTSKNKMSSHYSRYCNATNKPSKRRKLSDIKSEV